MVLRCKAKPAGEEANDARPRLLDRRPHHRHLSSSTTERVVSSRPLLVGAFAAPRPVCGVRQESSQSSSSSELARAQLARSLPGSACFPTRGRVAAAACVGGACPRSPRTWHARCRTSRMACSLLSPRAAVRGASRSVRVRIRALALSDASTGVRERAAVSHADVVTVVVHLELDVVVVVVVARRRAAAGGASRCFSTRFSLSPPPFAPPLRLDQAIAPAFFFEPPARADLAGAAMGTSSSDSDRAPFVRSLARSRRLVRRRPNLSRPMNALRSRLLRRRGERPRQLPRFWSRRALARRAGVASRRGRAVDLALRGTPAGETQSRGGDSRSRILRDLEASVGVLLVRITLGVGAFFVTGHPVVPDSRGALGADVTRPRHGLKVLRIFSPRARASRSRASPRGRILER